MGLCLLDHDALHGASWKPECCGTMAEMRVLDRTLAIRDVSLSMRSFFAQQIHAEITSRFRRDVPFS